ncbi:MAG: PAS domain S-box protein, partial [Bacteroidetes bacterium]|nr:PAS domain S-box protein [Bacteroidota bacterium]
MISHCLYAVFLADNTGGLLEANHIALSIFGYSTQEINSLTIEDILVLTSESPRQVLQSADTTYNLFTLATGIRKNKEHFPIEYTSVMFTDADGNSRTSIMVKDVTDQENSIRLFTEKLRLLELSEKAGNTCSWSWNLASHSFDCSDNFLKLCGYSETTGKAVNLFEIVHPHQKEKLISCIQQVVETGTSKETEFPVIGEDSRERPLLFHIHPVKDADACINSIAGTIVPIDHTKKPVDFRPMVESIRDGFFMLDNNWIITYWNREIEEISGVKSEKVVGRSFWDFFSSLGNLKLYSECRKAKQLNTSSRFEEFIQYNNAWIEVQVYPSEEGLSVFFKNITDKKNAEEAMRLSNERFDLVVKATNDLVWDWDIIKGEIYRNDSGVERVFGHKSTEQMKTNQQWLDFIHPDDRNRIDEQIAYYISSDKETSFNFEYRFRREDGEYNYINDRGYIIRNKLGIVVRMIGAARDVTEQKKIAKEIEESEQRYKMFVQQSTEGIWRIELNKPIPVDMPVEQKISHCLEHAYLAECNDTFACMYGFEDAASMSGIPLIKIMPPDNPVNIGYLRRFFSNNFKVTDEISYEYNRAGNRQTFTNNMIGIVENGYIKRAWGTQREITKQKKAEEMLLASEEQYRSLFDESPFCIIVWDITDFSIVKVNQACIDLYGYSREEFLKLTVLDIRPKEDRDSFREFAKKLHETPPHKTTMIAKHITRKKESIYMDITGHPIVYEGKRCMMAMSNNVTEKVQLEKSLNAERKIRQKQVTDAMLT